MACRVSLKTIIFLYIYNTAIRWSPENLKIYIRLQTLTIFNGDSDLNSPQVCLNDSDFKSEVT